MNKQLFRLTLFLLVGFSVLSTAAAQVEISVVPSANNPAVGYQIEVSINIAGGSNVAGYDFRLTFNSTILELINIENSDYLPGVEFSTAADYRSDGTYVPEIATGDGSVRFAAATLKGTGEGDGTLAIATFKVLAETETTIGLERVVIGNRMVQEIAIASVKGATITPTAATTSDVEFRLRISRGISLIHIPLKVKAINGIARTITSIADLYDALGGASTVNFLATYDPSTQEWPPYLGPSDKDLSANVTLTADTGIAVGLKEPVSLHLRGGALGTAGTGTITLNPGLNVVGLPLRNSQLIRVSDLFTLEGIDGNVREISIIDDGEYKRVKKEDVGSPNDIVITGGQSFIMTAQRRATVEISGDAWSNLPEVGGAPPMTMIGIKVDDVTPILALRGSIADQGRTLLKTSFRVIVKNRSTGRTVTTVTKGEYSDQRRLDGVGYKLTNVDLQTGRAAMIGDILEISAQSLNPLIGVEPLQYTITAKDVRQSWIQLQTLRAYEIPAETALLHNYPNPFNPETWIPYQLAHAADVTLTIYDTKGTLVRQLDLGHQEAGYYTDRARAAYWDGRNNLGEAVGSGIYFYQLRAANYSITRKMVILK